MRELMVRRARSDWRMLMKLKRIPFNGFWNIDLVQFEAFAPAPNRLNIQFTLYRDSIDRSMPNSSSGQLTEHGLASLT